MRIIRAWEKPKAKPGFRGKTISAAASVVGTPIQACVAHRCDAHEDVKPLNINTPEATECGACIAADLGEMLTIYNDMRDRLERACGALNLLSPGAGDSFLPPVVEETAIERNEERRPETGATDQADPEPDQTPPLQVDQRRTARKRRVVS